MRNAAIEQLLKSIGYPEQAPDGADSFTLFVDGGEIVAQANGRGLRLMCSLTDDESQLPRLAGYAAGRMLREDAVLSCGRQGAFLWQDIPPNSDRMEMQRNFEVFADACDWWRARLSETDGGGEASSPFAEMMIRP